MESIYVLRAFAAPPKKPKAKDPHMHEMTFEEKQRLSASLHSLLTEKLENIVQIIKKRNPSLCQQEDEIEVDIDSFDTEMLWELDRFVNNCKKSMRIYRSQSRLLIKGICPYVSRRMRLRLIQIVSIQKHFGNLIGLSIIVRRV